MKPDWLDREPWNHFPMMDKTISHYCILEKLGEGGMGVVHEAGSCRPPRAASAPPGLLDFCDLVPPTIPRRQWAVIGALVVALLVVVIIMLSNRRS